MINIRFPDGAEKKFEDNVTPLDIANSISKQLASKILVAEVNGMPWDITRAIEKDATIHLYTFQDEKGKETFWHSTAHLMASAVEKLYPGVKFWVGPALDMGFYYDMDLGDQKITDADLPRIEKEMRKLSEAQSPYIRKVMPKKEAEAYFSQKGDEYKTDLIAGFGDDETITFYTQGDYTDLCRGPHLPNTGLIKAFKLTNISGAYWKGNDKNKQLTRIYGISFPSQKELDNYLKLLEEAKLRDHRKLSREMGIYMMDEDVGPGLPLWLPNGTIIIEELEKLAKETEYEAGYHRVVTPHIAKESLFLKSGHLPYYADSMFPPMQLDGETYYLKAMNCPMHHKIFANQPRSYRDMPYRIAEYGTCYRYEQSGELFGLMRVRCMHMNDAHIYIPREQFAEEFEAVNNMYLKYFKIFGIDKFIMRLSLHDPARLGIKYVNEPKLWKETEDMVRKVLIDTNTPFKEVKDEAAFYGPKIDVEIFSIIGREFTLATNQVDFNAAKHFNLNFTNKNNELEAPLVIHRAPLGTHERFIGFLLEHFGGNLPTWLAPTQVRILPISERHISYADQLKEKLSKAHIRVETDDRNEKIGKKIREAELNRVPYMLVIGDKEMEENQVSIRRHGKGDLGKSGIDEFINKIVEEIAERKLN